MHVQNTFLRQQLSGLRQTYLRPLNRLETRTVAKIHQPSSPLSLSSHFLHGVLYVNNSFLLVLFLLCCKKHVQ